MEVRGFLQNPRFTRAFFIFCALAVILLIINVFVIGGAQFFQFNNTLLSPVVALVTSFLFFRARSVVKDPDFRLLWSGMGLGFGLWGIADIIWAIYELALKVEVPNPSIADFIWVTGYIPLFLALYVRLRTMKWEFSRLQVIIALVVTLAWLVGGIGFGVAPLISGFDPQHWLEGFAGLTYAFGDLGLAILSSLILIMLKGGRYTLSWRLIIAGLFIMTISDMIYANASSVNLYYPDGAVNIPTILADTTYILAYLCSAFGVYIYIWTWEIKDTFVMNIVTTPSVNYYAFLATNAENRIITASNNFYRLVNEREDTSFYKFPLDQVLGIDALKVQSILNRLAANGSIYNEPVHVKTLDQQTHPVLLSAIAIFDQVDQTFSGANIALRSSIVVPEVLRRPDNKELLGMMKHILDTTSTHSKEECQSMRAYFLETIRLFSAMLYQYGGPKLKMNFLDQLNQESRQKNLRVELTEQVISISEDLEGEDLANVLLPLLQAARRFTSNIIGDQIVKDKVGEFEDQLAPTLLAAVEKYKLRLYLQLA